MKINLKINNVTVLAGSGSPCFPLLSIQQGVTRVTSSGVVRQVRTENVFDAFRAIWLLFTI